MPYTGRKLIYTDATEITSANVVKVLRDALVTHEVNRHEIDYLYRYYKGEHPAIQGRVKECRPEICNRVVVNRANEIVSFKTGYLMGEPVQYTARGDGDDLLEQINLLNECMYSEGKEKKDYDLAEWFYICGTSYRMVLPDDKNEIDESPFEIFTLDPRNTFVVYSSGLGHKPMMGVTYVTLEDGQTKIYTIYTPNRYMVVKGEKVEVEQFHSLGDIPIIEYPANESRLGAFEITLDLLDSIDLVESNRIDGIEQFVQALMVFKGASVDSETLTALRQDGAFMLPSEADVEYLVQELNQGQTQVVIDDLYKTILCICGMPSQGDGNTSDSSNNGAVILKNGWQSAESRAKQSERMFKQSEFSFLKIALRIAKLYNRAELKLGNIEIVFTRRSYENISQKADVLVKMLSNDKIHPQLAFESSGLFIDPERAYTMSKDYAEEQQKKAMEEQQKALEIAQTKSEENADGNEEIPDEV